MISTPALNDWLARAWGRTLSSEPLPGVLASLLLHGLILFCILFLFYHRPPDAAQKSPAFVPVDVVEFGDQTTAPPEPVHAAVPQQKAMRGPASAPRPEAVAPNRTRPAPDALEVQLKNLAKLRQPDSDLTIENDGASDVTATSNGAEAGPTAYSVRDFIRAQILRRWNLDLSKLGSQTMLIALHVQLSKHGAVLDTEILDKHRYTTDAVYRDIAISARNAVLLSAPFKLPEHTPERALDFTLKLNPRDTLR
ncbi:MAG TPA: hypothetical protein VHU87_02030 [Rhizomicrobium sp.]|jgi:hypothetical protein|nr:hypothetical protein [Rhizomicrobium sp.]